MLRQMSPGGTPARRLLAASLAQLGRMEEARTEAEKAMKENPILLGLRLCQPWRRFSTTRIVSIPWRASSRPAFRGEIPLAR